jgi:hypothetical protein
LAGNEAKPSRKKSRKKSTPPKRKSRVTKAAANGEKSGQQLPSIDQQVRQLISYFNELSNFAGQVKANVESFKLGVEKQNEGIKIDTLFRASIRSDDIAK